MQLAVPGALSLKGRVTIRGYRAGAVAAVQRYADTLMLYRQEMRHATHTRPAFEHMVAKLQRIIEETLAQHALGIENVSDNLIMTGSLTGRDLLVQYLINGTTYTGGINYGALGTGSTTPAASDTQLTTESARVVPSIANDINNNQVQLQFYFPDANLANATYHEAGSFMNGTASANSGKIFNHALLGTPYTKTAGTDTTLEIDITFT